MVALRIPFIVITFLLIMIVIVIMTVLCRIESFFMEQEESSPLSPRVYIVINSCKKFVTTSVPALLSTLSLAGVPNDRIIVVVGESLVSDEVPAEIGAVKVVMVPYGNIDNNGLMWISFLSQASDLEDDSLFVYLHDTCVVLDNFWYLVLQATDKFQDTTLIAAPMRSFPSMNIGIYRTSVVRSVFIRSELNPIVNYDLQPNTLLSVKQDGYHGEDFVFKMLQSIGQVTALLDEEPQQGEDFYYPGGIKRYTEIYKGFGVVKMKANKGFIKFIEV